MTLSLPKYCTPSIWLPLLSGTYRVDLEYGDQAIPGSPFYTKVYSAEKVIVQDLRDGVVGKRSTFTGMSVLCKKTFCQWVVLSMEALCLWSALCVCQIIF